MRRFFSGLAIVAALAVPGASSAHAMSQAAKAALEAKAQAFAEHYSPATSMRFADIKAAFGVKLVRPDAHCAAGLCKVRAYGEIPDKAGYFLRVSGISTDFKSLHQPFTLSAVELSIELSGTGDDQCFSQTEWNTHLAASGWEPLLPYAIETRVWGMGDPALDDRTYQHKGFATRRGASYLTLLAPDEFSLGNSVDTAAIDALERRQGCMTELVIGHSPLDYRRSRGTFGVWDAETQAEFDGLQIHLQTLASAFSLDTNMADVEGSLGLMSYGVDQPCSAICRKSFEGHGGTLAPFHIILFQLTTKVDSLSREAFKDWKPEHAYIDIRLDETAPPGLCFSASDWNDALVSAGWEPLKPFAITRRAYTSASEAPTDEGRVDIAASGFATRRGDIYLTVASAANSDQFLRTLNPPEDIAAVEALGPCLRSVAVGDSLDIKAAYDAANGHPTGPPSPPAS